MSSGEPGAGAGGAGAARAGGGGGRAEGGPGVHNHCLPGQSWGASINGSSPFENHLLSTIRRSSSTLRR